MSYNDINSIRKKDLVEKIEKMKSNICNQIEKLTESLNHVTAVNERITSMLVIVNNVTVNLENRIIHLEKLQAKAEQYNRKNNTEISRIKYLMRILKRMLSRFVKILT